MHSPGEIAKIRYQRDETATTRVQGWKGRAFFSGWRFAQPRSSFRERIPWLSTFSQFPGTSFHGIPRLRDMIELIKKEKRIYIRRIGFLLYSSWTNTFIRSFKSIDGNSRGKKKGTVVLIAMNFSVYTWKTLVKRNWTFRLIYRERLPRSRSEFCHWQWERSKRSEKKIEKIFRN